MESPLEPDILPALYRIATLASGSTSHAAVARLALTAITESLRASAGALLLLNPETNRLEFECACNLDPGYGAPGLELGQGLPGWSALHAQPVLAARVESDHRYRPLRDATRCQMAAPLLVEEYVIGVIVLDHDHADGFPPDALTRLVRLADETARVLRRVGRFQQLEDKARQLETLISAGQSLVGKLAPQELFDTLTRDACRLLGVRGAALYLCDEAREQVRCVALRTPAAIAAPTGDLPTGACLVGSSIRTSRQTEFADIQSPEFLGLADLPADPALRSALVTPLFFEHRLLGALALFSGRVHRFDNDAKRLCAGLANLGAVALENTRLYARVFQSEETLRQHERLTTLGLLAAEIAHEIRNPLTVLKLLHGGLGLDFAADDPRRTDLRVISEKLDQLEDIVTRVLQFGKAPSSNLHSRWTLLDVVNDTLVLVRLKLAQAKVHLRVETSGPPPIIEGHKGQLQQILINLIFNSMHAMPDGGTITIAIGTREICGASCATLDLGDTGSGIPPPLAHRIFNSFLSGRPDGTGLGLAIAKRILLSHRGDIALASTGPAGTTMRITLPLAH